jgi:hypothetical protein
MTQVIEAPLLSRLFYAAWPLSRVCLNPPINPGISSPSLPFATRHEASCVTGV